NQRQGEAMELDGAVDCEPLTGRGARCDERGGGATPNVEELPRICRPRQVGALTQRRLVVESHQFGQLLGAVSTDSRQPFRDRCVCLGPPADRQATVRDVADKRVLEGVLHLAGQTRGGSHGDESPTLELAHPLRHIRGSDRDSDRLFHNDTTDDCGLADCCAVSTLLHLASRGMKDLASTLSYNGVAV